jgi:OOP family OmpA-OmpF porin
MKIKLRHQALAAMLLASAVQSGFAANDDTPYMGLMGTYEFPGAPRNLDKGFGATVLFGFPVSDYFAPELTLFGLRADRNGVDDKETSYGGGLNFAIYPFTRNHAVSPFLLVGGGAERDKHLSGNKTSGYADAGGGLLIALNDSRSTAIRIEGGRYGVFDKSVEPGRSHVLDTRISAGVQFALGSEAPPPPPPPPPPPVLRDSDGDGVLDDVDQCPGTPRGVVVDSRGCPLPPPVARVAPPPRDSDGDGVLDDVDNCPRTPVGMRVDANGCAIKAAVVVLHDINFELDKARLTSTARASLDNIVAGLKGQPSMKLEIDGHTDATGSDVYNLKLSKARAASARGYLIEQGIDGSRLKSEGFGESKPMTSNKTREGRAQNRRVEFKVLEQ